MAQIFRINQNSTLPTLRMELINDGRYDFLKNYTFNNSIQNATITFTMKSENDVLKISKAPAEVYLENDCDCEERYIIEYKWKKRDTKEKGKFQGWFEIVFNDDLYEDGVTYDNGNLIMPIQEPLFIYIS